MLSQDQGTENAAGAWQVIPQGRSEFAPAATRSRAQHTRDPADFGPVYRAAITGQVVERQVQGQPAQLRPAPARRFLYPSLAVTVNAETTPLELIWSFGADWSQ